MNSKPSSLDVDGRLEGEPAAAGVAHFVQVGVAGELDHWRRATHQDEGVVAGGRQVFPHHVLTDEALAVLPVWNTEKSQRLFMAYYDFFS